MTGNVIDFPLAEKRYACPVCDADENFIIEATGKVICSMCETDSENLLAVDLDDPDQPLPDRVQVDITFF